MLLGCPGHHYRHCCHGISSQGCAGDFTQLDWDSGGGIGSLVHSGGNALPQLENNQMVGAADCRTRCFHCGSSDFLNLSSTVTLLTRIIGIYCIDFSALRFGESYIVKKYL